MKPKTKLGLLLISAAILFSLNSTAQQNAETADISDRTVLPIKAPIVPAITELDARNAKKPDRFQVTAPKGAPNVLIILIDDQGFGVSSAFGGPVKQPTLDKMATEGLRYNNFNTCALCSPTRNAIQPGTTITV
jgi:arylsulfatase